MKTPCLFIIVVILLLLCWLLMPAHASEPNSITLSVEMRTFGPGWVEVCRTPPVEDPNTAVVGACCERYTTLEFLLMWIEKYWLRTPGDNMNIFNFLSRGWLPEPSEIEQAAEILGGYEK